MSKVICINNKFVRHENGCYSSGDGLIEGEIYNTDDKVYIHPNNKKECYFIIELNDLKLISRFVPVSDMDETEVVESEMEMAV